MALFDWILGRKTTKSNEDMTYEEYKESSDWDEIIVPKNRPDGKWINWPLGGGWLRITGTSYCRPACTNLLKHLNRFNQNKNRLEISLKRDPNNTHDPKAIEVWVSCWNGSKKTLDSKIGFVGRDESHWLADNFTQTMPIAASLVKFSADSNNTSITICGLMPSKKDRAKLGYDL